MIREQVKPIFEGVWIQMAAAALPNLVDVNRREIDDAAEGAGLIADAGLLEFASRFYPEELPALEEAMGSDAPDDDDEPDDDEDDD